jgi:integrase
LRYTDAEGRSREKKRKCATRRQASHRIRELRAEVEDDKKVSKTFADLDNFYRTNYVHPATYSGTTKLTGFRQDLRIIEIYLDRALEHFCDRSLDSITYIDLAKYKAKVASTPIVHGHRADRQRSSADINHHLRRLRRLFNVAVEQGWISENPFRRGPALIIESIETGRTRILTAEEEARLLAACDRFRQHLRPRIIFAVETGLRRGEIGTLLWSSVNIEKRFLRVESLNSKTMRSRLVPLSDRSIRVLEGLWRNSARSERAQVFGSSDFKKAFAGACAEAGLEDIHFHDLRHTAITRMLEAGISPPLVMKIAGHSQMKTFMRYVNQTETSIFEIAHKLDQSRGSSTRGERWWAASHAR